MSVPYPRFQYAHINGQVKKRIIRDPSEERPDVWKESPAEFYPADGEARPDPIWADPGETERSPAAPAEAAEQPASEAEAPAPHDEVPSDPSLQPEGNSLAVPDKIIDAAPRRRGRPFKTK